MSTTERTPEGRFPPGQSGNPAGRKPGSRNKGTMAAEALLDGEAEAVTKRIAGYAMGGDPVAMRLCFDRLAPRPRGRPVTFDLPRLTTLADAVDAASAIVAGVGAGELTSLEGTDLIKLVEAFAGVRATSDLGGPPTWRQIKSTTAAAEVNLQVETRRRMFMEKIEQQEADKLRFLRKAWQEGIDSGDAGEVDFSALKQEARARLAPSKE